MIALVVVGVCLVSPPPVQAQDCIEHVSMKDASTNYEWPRLEMEHSHRSLNTWEFWALAPWCYPWAPDMRVWFHGSIGTCYSTGQGDNRPPFWPTAGQCRSSSIATGRVGMNLGGGHYGMWYGTWVASHENPPGSGNWVVHEAQDFSMQGPFPPGGSGGEECNETNGFWEPELGQWLCYSPILMPAGIRGEKYEVFRLTSPDEGVYFDLDGDGNRELISWTAKNAKVGFLALDRNGNGYIDNGKELFGNFTVSGQPNGFAALAALAGPGAGSNPVQEGKPFFESLLLWVDANHDGVSQAEELEPVSKYYVEIGLGYKDDATRDRFGNYFRYKGYAEVRHPNGRVPKTESALFAGRIIDIYDVYFQPAK